MIRFKAKTDEKPTPNPAKTEAKVKPVEKDKAKTKIGQEKDLLDLAPNAAVEKD